MSVTTITDVFCTGKRAFKSFAEASSAASKTAHGRGARCHPYKCSVCGSYHYGQTDRRTKNKARRPRREFREE